MRIILPIPHRLLSPNHTPWGRRGLMARAHLTKTHRQKARLTTQDAITTHTLHTGEPLPTYTGYTLHFYHSVRRRRDDDNLSASCKAYRDGIADALGIDDHWLRLLSPPTQNIDKANPRLEIILHVWPFEKNR